MTGATGFSRMRLGLLVAVGVGVSVAVLAAFATTSGDDASSAEAASAGDRVKVTIAGTNDALVEQTDGGIAGEGTFTARGAITDHGTVRAYRGLSILDPKVILLRFVTKGKKGAITYAVTIDTKPRPVVSEWTIQSASKAYKGLHGKGTETENATWTVSTLRGTVWR